jgi:hypothetical protein
VEKNDALALGSPAEALDARMLSKKIECTCMCRNEGETTHCTWLITITFAWRACRVTSPANTCGVLYPPFSLPFSILSK